MLDNTNDTDQFDNVPPAEPPADIPPADPDPEPAPEAKKRPWLIIALIGGLVLAGLGVGAWALLHTSPIKVTGSLMLAYEAPESSKYSVDLGNYVTSESTGECYGIDGYDDIIEGASVTIRGENGQLLGIGHLEAGTNLDEIGCLFDSNEIEVPGDQKFYTMEVTHRGDLTAAADEIVNGKLNISGSLG